MFCFSIPLTFQNTAQKEIKYFMLFIIMRSLFFPKQIPLNST